MHLHQARIVFVVKRIQLVEHPAIWRYKRQHLERGDPPANRFQECRWCSDTLAQPRELSSDRQFTTHVPARERKTADVRDVDEEFF
jgi:hypothetical protein